MTTKECAEVARCPVCREAYGDPCNFLAGDSIRQARDYEIGYHRDRLRVAEHIPGLKVCDAIRTEAKQHFADRNVRHFLLSVIELLAAATARERPATSR